MDHRESTFDKVCESFEIPKLNTLQEEAIRYLTLDEKDVFVRKRM